MTAHTTFSARQAFAEILDPANRHNPYPFFRALSEQPVMRLDEHQWTVSTYDGIARVLRDPRASAQTGLPYGEAPHKNDSEERSLLLMDPPRHDTLRGELVRQFAPRLSGVRDQLGDLVSSILDAQVSDQPGVIDLVDALAYPLPVAVICHMLGVPRADEPIFAEFAKVLTAALDPQIDPAETERIRAEAEITRERLRAYLTPLIEDRLRSPRSDLLSGLLGTDLQLHQVMAVVGLLLIAGHETTVNLIANGVLALLRHPEVLLRLRRDPSLSAAVVEEVLRYDPPVQMCSRVLTADMEVGGVTVPAGDKVTLLLAAGNRDPRRFENPDVFWPERPDNAHLGFSSGVHYCMGAPLARMEGQLAFNAVARRLVNPRLVDDPPTYRTNMLLRGPDKLTIAYDRLTA